MKEDIMETVTLIGIDLGKNSFHVHAHDQHGRALLRKKLIRKQFIGLLANFHPCTIAMEACAGAYFMARQQPWQRGQATLGADRAAFRLEQQERFHRRRGDLRSVFSHQRMNRSKLCQRCTACADR
jgi:transposase